MHTYHRLAVEADNEQDAKSIALEFAEKQEWSDWCQIPEVVVSSGEIKVATNYKADPQGFTNLVDQACKWTQETVENAVEMYGDIPLKDILTNQKYDFEYYGDKPYAEMNDEEKDNRMKESLAVFRITRAFKVLNREYSPDTMFYDTVEWSPNPKWMEKRLETDPDNQWIVIVDYHF
jgi:hypothetical protein